MRRSAVYVDVIDAHALLGAVRPRTYRGVATEAGCAFAFLADLCNGRANRVRAELAAGIEDACDRPRGSLFQLAPDAQSLIEPYLRTAVRS